MYCPSCGSNNLAEVKFCKHCGTNLNAVSEALTGKISGRPSPEDRVAKLMRDFYRGRRDAITGAVLIPAALLIMALMVVAGLKPVAAFFIICWMFFWGAGSLAAGLGKWIAANAELKSFGSGVQSQIQGSLQSGGPSAQPALSTKPYTTGSVDYPGSVTDQTTRQLDKRGRSLAAEHPEKLGE